MPEAITPPPATLEVVYDEGGRVRKEPTERRRAQVRENSRVERTRFKLPLMTSEEYQSYRAIVNGHGYQPKRDGREDNGEKCCQKQSLMLDIFDRTGFPSNADGTDCCQLSVWAEHMAQMYAGGALAGT